MCFKVMAPSAAQLGAAPRHLAVSRFNPRYFSRHSTLVARTTKMARKPVDSSPAFQAEPRLRRPRSKRAGVSLVFPDQLLGIGDVRRCTAPQHTRFSIQSLAYILRYRRSGRLLRRLRCSWVKPGVVIPQRLTVLTV